MKIFKDSAKDYLYHFSGQKIYFMFNHRFALWCWINEISKEEFGKFNLVHIDTHHDCGELYPEEKKKIFFDSIGPLKDINKFKTAKYSNSDLIGYGSFLGVALRGDLFKKISFFTRSDNVVSSYRDSFKNFNPANCHNTEIEYYEKENFDKLKDKLKNNSNIFLDLDLDYFTDDLSDSEKVFSEERFSLYFKLIKDNIDNIKVMTIAVTNEDYLFVRKKFVEYFKLEF